MLIGIMSDSHDNISMIKRAVSIMKERGVDLLLHAGDFIAPFSIPYLKDSGAQGIIGVFGNNDGEKAGLKKAFERIGGVLEKAPHKYEIDSFIVYMMHEPYFLADAVEDPDANLIIHGHTHKLSIERKRGKILLNPGETCGYITGKKTMIFLDTDIMEPEVVELD
jgi:putative phosphoesterase